MKNYRKIWENANGPIPVDELGRSYEIHHIDGNRENNDLNNLICVSIEEHYQIHYEQKDYAACSLIADRLGNNSFCGWNHCEETKIKISAANKGKIRTEEHKRKMSKAQKGKTLSEETKQKMSDFRRGKSRTEETIRKVSIANKGKTRTEETKQKMSDAHKGKSSSEETKQKMSDARKGKTLSEETKQKMSDSKKGNQNWIGKKHSEETKQKMRETQKGKPLPKIKCPHCNKEGGGSLMKRYHFSNCKTPRI